MPERTCLICRGRSPQSELLRLAFVKAENREQAECSEGTLPAVRVVVDVRRILPGRGVYIHQHERCLASPRFTERLQRAGKGRAGKSNAGKGRVRILPLSIADVLAASVGGPPLVQQLIERMIEKLPEKSPEKGVKDLRAQDNEPALSSTSDKGRAPRDASPRIRL